MRRRAQPHLERLRDSADTSDAERRPIAALVALPLQSGPRENGNSMPYRIFVCVLGLLITMLAVTGVYIWWKKRRARKYSASRRGEAADAEEVAAG